MSAATDASNLQDADLDTLLDRRSAWERTKTLAKKIHWYLRLGGPADVVYGDLCRRHHDYDPEDISFGDMLVSPNFDFLLGTDQLGRDIFTRIVYGARTALLVGITASVVGAFIGLILGVASAYFGGTFDLLFQRFMDVFMAFPLIILALAIVSISVAVSIK